MSRRELTRRYILFVIAVIICGIGTAGFAVSGLGATPYSSMCYELSFHVPLTLGTILFIMNAILIVLQFVLLRPEDRKRSNYIIILTQIPINFIFSGAVDGPMFLMYYLIPEAWFGYYAFSFTAMILSCLVLLIGVSLQIVAGVSMITGTAFTNVLAKRLNRSFGSLKLVVDVTMVSTAILIGLIFTGFTAVQSVREGTIINGLTAGPLSRLLLPRLKFIDRYLKDPESEGLAKAEEAFAQQRFHKVITISREFGAGGKYIAKILAKQLGIAYYDKELIEMIAKESGFSPEYVQANEAPTATALLYDFIMQDTSASPFDHPLSTQDALFVATSKVIRRLAQEKPCVFVGRLADVILKDNPHKVSVFLHARTGYRIRFCQEKYHMEKEEAIKAIHENDRRRSRYHYHYTGKHMNDSRNYNISLDVGYMGVDNVVRLISHFYAKA